MSDTLAEPLSVSLSLRRSRSTATKSGARTRARGPWRGRPLVIGERLFRDALNRERRRADRFEQPFVLVLVALKSPLGSDPTAWVPVIGALAEAKRDTDLLGWYEKESVLGLIVPEINGADTAFARDVEARVQQALTARLDVDMRSDFDVRLYRHVGPKPTTSAATDALLPAELHRSGRARVRAAFKRGFDVVASASLLLAASPLFLLIALLVKLKSPGPVFFRQVRVGELGKPFTMLKFRTMHVRSDDAIHKAFVSQLIKGEAPKGDGAAANGAVFKIANDPRVTAVGRILRKTSLDELPQLWNVLVGDMSLVGPRPPLAYEVEQYKPWHYRRVLEAKPGMTGLWQVSGRSRMTFDDMVRLDLRYAKQCSPWMDIKILMATPKAVISGKGAV